MKLGFFAMRNNPPEHRFLNPNSGVLYFSIVAYFSKPAPAAGRLLDVVVRHVSELTGDLAGEVLVWGPRGIIARHDARSTCPVPQELERTISGSEAQEVRQALFEVGSVCKGLEGVARVRPKVLVVYSSEVPMWNSRDCEALHSLTINVRTAYVRRHAPAAVTDWLDRLWNFIDAETNCAQGLATLTSPDAGYSIGEFDQGGEGFCAWERRLGQARFLLASDRLERVRGVYWGVFIGRTLARKLDPSGTFLERFNALPQHGSISSPIGRATGKGSYWLQLNADPLGGEPDTALGEHVGIENALWLESELRGRSLLL